MEDKVEKLVQLAALVELLSKCKEIVQGNDLVGGHRGNVDEYLTSAQNEAFDALEELKGELNLQ